MNDNLSRIQDQLCALEQEAATFQLKQPRKPPEDVKTSVKVEEFTDQYIYRVIFSKTKDDLFALSRAIRTTTTNDRLRAVFRNFLKKQLDNYNDFNV